jgi:hypothetical protein
MEGNDLKNNQQKRVYVCITKKQAVLQKFVQSVPSEINPINSLS